MELKAMAKPFEMCQDGVYDNNDDKMVLTTDRYQSEILRFHRSTDHGRARVVYDQVGSSVDFANLQW